MRYLPILFALLFASPASAACATWSTVWPACTVQFTDGRDLEEKYGFFDETICNDNDTPGTCDSGGTFWRISGAGIGEFSQAVKADTFLPIVNDWLAFGDSDMTEIRIQSDNGWAFIDAGFTMSEEAAWPGSWQNGYGSIWTKTGAPNTLFFHDDFGQEWQLGALQGNCTVQPCLDGSADGGTTFSLFETAWKGTFEIKAGALGADVVYQLGDNNQPPSTTDLRIPVMNHSGYNQIWQGQQSFNEDVAGTRIKRLLTNVIEPRQVSQVMTYGASTVPGHNFISVGGTVIFNASMIATERSGGSALTPGQGEFYVKDDDPTSPGFRDDSTPTGENHVLAYLDDNVFTGTQEIQDDLFYTGDGSGIPYGSMYNHDGGTTVNIIALSTPTQVPSGFLQGEVNLATFGNAREITVTKAGQYKTPWQISFTTATANQEIEGGVMVDGVADLTITAHRRIGTATDTGSMGATGILDLDAGAVVSLWVMNESSSTVDVNIEHANLALVMVGGT